MSALLIRKRPAGAAKWCGDVFDAREQRKARAEFQCAHAKPTGGRRSAALEALICDRHAGFLCRLCAKDWERDWDGATGFADGRRCRTPSEATNERHQCHGPD